MEKENINLVYLKQLFKLYQNICTIIVTITIAVMILSTKENEKVNQNQTSPIAQVSPSPNPSKEAPKVKEIERNQLSLKQDAYFLCKKYMEANLKSPKTAEFPMFDYEASIIKKDTYLIKSYVDSQNSFGALLRTNYSCKLKCLNYEAPTLPSSWEILELKTAK